MSATFNETQSTAPIVLIGDQAGITVIPPDTPLQRLNYFEGKFLRADDLTAEQEYVRSLAEQTAKAGGAGIAYGFDTRSAGDALLIGPGLAFDSAGRPLLLSHEVRIDIAKLIAESRRLRPSLFTTAAGTQADFGDCILAEDPVPTAVVQPGTTCWRISIAHADAYCGVEDVFGRLCEDACITKTDRPYRVEGIVIRATPFTIPATPHGVVALTRTHLRSLIASAAFAAEANAFGSQISRSGLAQNTWCLGAGADTRPDVSLGIVVRHSDAHGFLDVWSVRRERIEPPARRYWAGRMALRPLDVFLAQVLQFQCQLHEGAGDSGPLDTPAPCAPHITLLSQASSYLDEVRSLASTATGVPSLAGGIARLDELRTRIATLATAQPVTPTSRILIEQGFVEVPSAGYLPVQPGPSPTVNDQMRALFGEGVDVRVCIVRPDFVGHALEEAQHMERISLLQGLDHPDQKPHVDVLVPDGERVQIVTHPPGRGFQGVVRVMPGAPPSTPTRTLLDTAALSRVAELVPASRIAIGRIVLNPPQSAVGVNGAGRAEREESGGLAFHFAGAAPAPSALDVAALAHALAGAGSTDQANIDRLKAVKLSDAEVAHIQPAFFTRVTTLASDALRTRAEMLAAKPVFDLPVKTLPGIVFKPPVPAHEAVVVNLWVSLRADRNPLMLRAGESTALQIEVVLAMPSDKPSLLSYRILGTFAAAQPTLPRGLVSPLLAAGALSPLTRPNLLKRIRGRFSGVASVAATIEGAQHEAHSGELELDVSAVEDVLTAGAAPSLSLSFSRPDDGSWLATAKWGGAPLHIEVETSQQTSSEPLRLAAASLDANDDVLLPGNASHTVALSALEVIGAALGDPDWADAHGQLLFPPAPPPPDELIVRATRDWVLFHRRRDKECGERPAGAAAVARRYQLFSIAVPDSTTVEHVRRAVLQNDAATITSFNPTPVDVVEFAAGVGNLHTSPDAVSIDWQHAAPGGFIQYGVMLSASLGDGETLAQSRLARLEQALALVSTPADDLVNETLPYIPAPFVVPEVDGAILLVTRTRPTTCQSVYRLDPDNATEAAALAQQGDLKNLLSADFVSAVAEVDFDSDTGDLVSDRSALQTQWQSAGGGTPDSVVTISKKGDADAGAQGARLDRAVAVATALGGSSNVARNALEVAADLPVDCPVITLIVPAQRTSTARVVAFGEPSSSMLSSHGPTTTSIPLQHSVVTFEGDTLQTASASWPALVEQLQSIDTTANLISVRLGTVSSSPPNGQQRLSSFMQALSAANPPVSLQSATAPLVQTLPVGLQSLLTVDGVTVDELIVLGFVPAAVATECQSVYFTNNMDGVAGIVTSIQNGGTGAIATLQQQLKKIGDIGFVAGTPDLFGDPAAARDEWRTLVGRSLQFNATVIAAEADLQLAAQRAHAALANFAPAFTFTVATAAAKGTLPVACSSILVVAARAVVTAPTGLEVTGFRTLTRDVLEPAVKRTAQVVLDTGVVATELRMMAERSTSAGAAFTPPANLFFTFADDAVQQDATWNSVVQAVQAITGGTPVKAVQLMTDTADASATTRAASVVDALTSASLAGSATTSSASALTDTQKTALAAGDTHVDDVVVLTVIPDADLALSIREVATDTQLDTAIGLYKDEQTSAAARLLTPEIAAVGFAPGSGDPASEAAADTVTGAWAAVSDSPPKRLVLLMPTTIDADRAELHRKRAAFVAETLKADGVDEESVAPATDDPFEAVLLAERQPKDAERLVHVVALVAPAASPDGTTALPKPVALSDADLKYAGDADPDAPDDVVKAFLDVAAKTNVTAVAYDFRDGTPHDASERGRGFLAAVFRASKDIASQSFDLTTAELDAATVRAYLADSHAQDAIVVSLEQQ